MLRTAWIMVLACATQRSASFELPALSPLKQSIASCVVSISDEYFSRTETTAIMFSDRTNETDPIALDERILSSMFQFSARSIFVKASRNHMHAFDNLEVTHNYIVRTHLPGDLSSTLRFLQKSSWNPHAKFVIITTRLFENPLKMVSAMWQTLWSFHVVDAVILIPQMEDQNMLDVYTWFPFTASNCGDNFTECPVINQCRMGKLLLDAAPLFPDKIPDNLHGCPVTVRTVVWPPFVIPTPHLDLAAENVQFTEGTEIRLMNTIAEYTNFTVHYRVSQKKEDFGDMLANGSASEGLLKELVEEKVDIGIAALAATMKRITHLDYTIPYVTESITWCVPTADLEPQWLSVIHILHVSTWFATGLAFVGIILVIWAMSVQSVEESAVFKDFSSCSLYMFCTTLGITLCTLPRDTSVRIVYLMWVIYSLHLCVAFQTSLVSKLTKPSYEQQISTLQDIFNARMRFGYLASSAKYFEDNSTTESWIIQRYGDVCEDAEECLNRIALQRDYALALPRLYLVYVSERYLDQAGKSLIYWFKADTVSYPVQMFVYKGFPLLNKFNKLIPRIKAAGLVMQWLKEAMSGYVVSQSLVEAKDDEGADALSFQDMTAAFTILYIGLSLGTVTFVGEQLMYRLHLHQESKVPRKFIM